MTRVEEVSNVQTTILECVDAGLKELGQSVGKVVYFHLEKNFGISREEIPNKPEVFSQALHTLFGRGANVLEGLIVRRIKEKFKLSLDPQTSIVKAIEIAKTESF